METIIPSEGLSLAVSGMMMPPETFPQLQISRSLPNHEAVSVSCHIPSLENCIFYVNPLYSKKLGPGKDFFSGVLFSMDLTPHRSLLILVKYVVKEWSGLDKRTQYLRVKVSWEGPPISFCNYFESRFHGQKPVCTASCSVLHRNGHRS